MEQDAKPPARGGAGMWDALAPVWDRYGDWHAKTTRELTMTMVDALDPKAGETIVEFAGGPTADGACAAAARLAGSARVIASDLSEGMLAGARRRAAEAGLAIEFARLDVTELDLDDNSVDGVLARWVYMLLPDPAGAFAETRRVLRPGGRLVFAVFSAAPRNPFFMLYAGVLAERGLLDPPRPGAPSMFALADVAATTAMVTGAGFDSVTSAEVELSYRYADAEELWAYASEFSGPVALTILQLDESTRDEVRTEILARAEAYRDGPGYALPAVVHVYTCE